MKLFIWFRECLSFLRDSPALILLTALGVPCATVVWLYLFRGAIDVSATGFSVADVLVVTASAPGGGSALGMVVIPLSVIVALLLTDHDFRINSVTRIGSLKRLWQKKVFMAAVIALLFSIYISLIVTVFSFYETTTTTNFSQAHSLFSMSTNGATMQDPPLIIISLVFFCYCFLMTLIMNVLALLLNWFYSRIWLPIALVVTCGFLDLLPQPIPTIYSVVNIGYAIWLEADFSDILFCSIGLVLLILIGHELAERKEFLRER